MARLAGDESTYAWRLCRRRDDGVLVPTEYGEDFISISTVAKGVSDKSGPLVGWAWNVITEGVAHLAQFNEMRGWDQDTLKKALKESGYTPWVKRSRAAARGNEAHEVLQNLAEGADPAVVEGWIEQLKDPEVQGYCRGVFGWWMRETARGGIQPLIVEEPVWSFRHELTGTLDLYAIRELGEVLVPVLTDLKTSKDVYGEHWLQLDGYDLAVRDSRPALPVPVMHSVVLAGADGSFEERFREPDPEVFAIALDHYRAMRRYAA